MFDSDIISRKEDNFSFQSLKLKAHNFCHSLLIGLNSIQRLIRK